MTNSAELLKKMVYLRNFGHDNFDSYACVGINGKNSEFHAAMGLVNLKSAKDIMASRKAQAQLYDKELAELRVQQQKITPGAEWNYSYYPVVFESEEMLLKCMSSLNANWIYPRRYFYPSLSGLNYVKPGNTPISDDIAKRILCLPMYHTLKDEEIAFISRILLREQNN